MAALVVHVHSSNSPTLKISPFVKKTLENSGTCDILVVLNDGTRATLNNATIMDNPRISNLATRSASVREALRSHTKSSQASLLNFLSHRNLEFRNFWVTNQIFIRNADAELVSLLAVREDIARINKNHRIRIDDISGINNSRKFAKDPVWGIEKIRAPDVHVLPGGGIGTGIRVAILDTGVRGTHEALIDKYIGLNGWYDAHYGTTEPTDFLHHGTHVTGTIVGRGGIGVAPGAKWLACNACHETWCEIVDFISCGQWVICPTLPDGISSPDCEKTPHIISNSWGATEEMDEGDEFYDEIIDAWRAVGIIPIFGQGNEGEFGCETGRYPADKDNVIGVGATVIDNTLAYFSSRGPSAWGNIKPDIVAPGQDIWSAMSGADDHYGEFSGTSMATPHVSGIVALLLGIEPTLTFDQVASILYKGAMQDIVPPGENCGGIGEHKWPNNAIGHGQVNALHSAKLVIGNK